MQPTPVWYRALSFCLAFSLLIPAPTLMAQTSPLDSEHNVSETLPARASYYLPKHRPEKPRSFFWMPLASFAVPGLDQLIEGQWVAGSAYAGTWIAGELYSSYHSVKLREETDNDEYRALSREDKMERAIHGERERKVALGAQVAFASRSFSAYHAFRTAAVTQQPYGRFTFLKEEETPTELLLAPFQFQYLKNPRTFIPLSIVAGLAALTSIAEPTEEDEIKKDPLSRSDWLYTGAISYNAGTHEEALFRGWMMPVFMDLMDSRFWSNTTTTALFALAHLGSVDIPVAQAALGWHLGWVTQRNNWKISESIFIHAWWDVFAFLAAYQVKRRDSKAVLPPIWLPALTFNF